jgi:hypothetical protein
MKRSFIDSRCYCSGMTFLRILLAITFSLVIACGDDTSSDASVASDVGSADSATALDAAGSADATSAADATGAADVGATDVGATDAAGSADAEARDAAVGVDAGAMDAAADVFDAGTPDAGSACETRVEDRVPGVCDGIGMRICSEWANENGGMNAVAQCVRGAEGRCARANTCTNEGCMCGSEAECGETEMCVSGFAGFSCVCITPAS